MKNTLFLTFTLLLPICINAQHDSSYVKTYPYARMGIAFEKEAESLIMSVDINGHTLTSLDEFGFKITGKEKLHWFEITDENYTLDLMNNILYVALGSNQSHLIASNGIEYFFINTFIYAFNDNEITTIKESAQRAIKKKKKPKWIEYLPYWMVHIKFDYDEYFDPIMVVDMNGCGKILSKGDTLGFNIYGQEMDTYYPYSNEDSWDSLNKKETLELDYADAKLIIENGLNYMYINNYIYYFSEDDREALAEAARKVFR